MQFRLILILGLVLSLSNYAFSQDTEPKIDDRAGITSTIENYFEGWISSDTTLVSSAMHHSCHLKVVRDGKFAAYNKNAYLGFFTPGKVKSDSEGRIISIDITGNVASAKCELEIPKRIYTDYFNLIKIEDRWYISDKVSSSVGK